MNMTHPDILYYERTGGAEASVIGHCAMCGEPIYDGYERCQSGAQFFCDKECVFEYFNVEEVL